MIRSFVVITLTFAYILLVGPLFFMHALLTGRTDRLYACGRTGARFALWLAGARPEVSGMDKIPIHRAAVFMPNHQSLADGAAMIAILPPVVALVKKEFFRMPVLGRAMVLRGFIPVDRKNRERARQAIEEAAKGLRAGRSFIAFPEGTRSPDGKLQPFKKGVFALAIQAKAPIVPVSISGSRKIMSKGKWAIYPGAIRITFHEPVETAGCAHTDRAAIMERVRQAINYGLAPEEQSPLPSDNAKSSR